MPTMTQIVAEIRKETPTEVIQRLEKLRSRLDTYRTLEQAGGHVKLARVEQDASRELADCRARIMRGLEQGQSLPDPPPDATLEERIVETMNWCRRAGAFATAQPGDPDEPTLNSDPIGAAVLFVLAENPGGLGAKDIARLTDEWFCRRKMRQRCRNVDTIRPVLRRLAEKGLVQQRGERGVFTLSPKGEAWSRRHAPEG